MTGNGFYIAPEKMVMTGRWFMMFMVVLPTLDSNLEMGNHSEKKTHLPTWGFLDIKSKGFRTMRKASSFMLVNRGI